MTNWVRYKTCIPFKAEYRLRNAEPEAIIQALKDLQKECEVNAGRQHPIPLVVFLYYSGHGVMIDGDSHIIASNGVPINIDQFIRDSSCGNRIKFIALLVCCRDLAYAGTKSLGGPGDKAVKLSQLGERYIIYSTEGR